MKNIGNIILNIMVIVLWGLGMVFMNTNPYLTLILWALPIGAYAGENLAIVVNEFKRSK